ncbi:MAG TPA: hypothetical protein VFX70_21880 [Mycobacteriales bacterium]|nr:hypothetical protein [Mycobacteriales bacterium]
MDSLIDTFPWVTLLPDAARAQFADDFRAAARVGAATGQFDRLAITLSSWQATAEAYATPHLDPTGANLDYLDIPEPVPNPHEMP